MEGTRTLESMPITITAKWGSFARWCVGGFLIPGELKFGVRVRFSDTSDAFFLVGLSKIELESMIRATDCNSWIAFWCAITTYALKWGFALITRGYSMLGSFSCRVAQGHFGICKPSALVYTYFGPDGPESDVGWLEVTALSKRIACIGCEPPVAKWLLNKP